MASLTDITELKQRADNLQREADKAAGALEQTMARLKAEYGCDSIEKAERMLRRLQKEEEQAKDAFDDAVEQYEKDWPQ